MRRLAAATAFGMVATLAYASLTWRHQPVLMNGGAPGAHAIEGWMIASLVLAAFGTFASAWWVFLLLSKRRPAWLAGLTGGLAAALVPVLHLWTEAAAGGLVATRRAGADPSPLAFAVTFGVMELILASGLWYAVSLAAIVWFTVPLSAGVGMLFLLAQERLGLSGTPGRSGPPAPR